VSDARCPVLVLTGALGSGKTTLLRHWLQQDVLQSCVVIVNEIGQTAFDDARLGPYLVSAGALTQSCVCCTGLPDLRETLERLFWDRLHRRGPRFDRVVIETSGVASPRPVADLLALDPFLRGRFRLEAVIATVSGAAGSPGVPNDPSALEQLAGAQWLVITKRDRMDPTHEAPLHDHLARQAPNAQIVMSGLDSPPTLASLLAASPMALARDRGPTDGAPADEAAAAARWQSRPLGPRHGEGGPDVRTWFEPLIEPMALETLRQHAVDWITQAPSSGLVRLKGYWRCLGPLGGDQPWEVQWAQGDAYAQIGPVDLPRDHTAWGVTFIATPASPA
jgi:G3E family GTPase